MSYQSAESEIEALTGMKVSHSTQQRLVLRQEFPLPSAKEAVTEVSVDGGKVRLRGTKGEGSKRAGLQGSPSAKLILRSLFPGQPQLD